MIVSNVSLPFATVKERTSEIGVIVLAASGSGIFETDSIVEIDDEIGNGLIRLETPTLSAPALT